MNAYLKALCLGAALALAAGCASRTAQPPPLPTPPPPVAAAPLPLPELPAVQIEQQPVAQAPRQLYSINVVDANVRDVLLTLAKTTDFSIVLGPMVEGTITVDLKQVTVEEMLNAMLSPVGLVYQREGNVIRVSRPQVTTRIFSVNYIASQRSGSSSLSATAGASGGGGFGTTGAAAVIPSTATATTQTGGGSAAGGGSSSSVSSSDSVDFWGELQQTLTTFLTMQGRLVISQTAGLVAVTDLPDNINQVARYLELVQGSVQRQVMIEAKIIEVTLNKEFSAGVNWTLVPTGLDLPAAIRPRGTLENGVIARQTTPVSTGILQVGFGIQGFEALISALQQQGDVSILSSPRVSTLNNQKAVIKVATDDVFFTTATQREPLTGVVTQLITPNTITEGLVLDVTPQIGEDAITMNIRPSISERLREATSPAGDVVPVLAVRASDTVVRVRDGQTVVIGGLMQQRTSKTRTGVPGLQRAPIVGRAFRSDSDTEAKVELVILLTPTLLVGRGDTDLTPRELELLRDAGTVPRR
jgi:MSHA biogenesis protein MshL